MFPFLLEWGLILGSTKPGAANQILVRQPENDLRWPPGGRNEHWDGSMRTLQVIWKISKEGPCLISTSEGQLVLTILVDPTGVAEG